jgi:hypothetical protein
VSGRLLIVSTLCAVMALSSCGSSNLFAGRTDEQKQEVHDKARFGVEGIEARKNGSLADLFSNSGDPNVTVAVNRYLWNASLDVLSFLPIEAADPFSGVIVMGWGTPPGSRRSYRATVYVQDPALDARSLRVALKTRGGSADRDTVLAIEDAILTRARQLRVADGKL